MRVLDVLKARPPIYRQPTARVFASRFRLRGKRSAPKRWVLKGVPFDEAKHPRGYHGRFGHGIGHALVMAADSLSANTGSDGRLIPERRALHDSIVAKVLSGHAESANPHALFLGGGTASGKSTVVKRLGNIGAVIDGDALKAELPEYRAKIEAGESGAAAYVHEESSVLAKRITQEASRQHLDFALDGTGDSSIEKLRAKVVTARAAGHEVRALYVTTDTNTAMERAARRAERTGRLVPPRAIREIHASVSRTFPQAVAEDLFDTVELWDTTTDPPVLVGHKTKGSMWAVLDRGAWARFVSKGRVTKAIAMTDGEAAVRLTQTAASGLSFAAAGVTDGPAVRAMWRDISAEVTQAVEAGYVVSIPWDYTIEPMGSR